MRLRGKRQNNVLCVSTTVTTTQSGHTGFKKATSFPPLYAYAFTQVVLVEVRFETTLPSQWIR